MWNAKTNGNSKFGKRRALFEESQEVKASHILIGHSMGGVVSREYVQGDFYNGDVDKIITLDSPHEGTGALNMQLGLLLFCSKIRRKSFNYAVLDTSTGNVNELLAEEDFAWLNDCEDVVYLDGALAGLKKSNFGDEKVWLVIDGMLMDSLNLKKNEAYVGDYFEGAVKWNGTIAQVYLNSMDARSNLFSNPKFYLKGLSVNKHFDNQFPEIWMNVSAFADSSGKEVLYNAEDLYVVGEN